MQHDKAPASPFKNLPFMSGFGFNGAGPRKPRKSMSQGAILKARVDGSASPRKPKLQVDRRAALSRKLEQTKSVVALTPTNSEKNEEIRVRDDEEWGISGLLGREVQRRLTHSLDAAFGAIGGISNGLEGAAQDAANALGLDPKGKQRSKKGAAASQQQVKRVMLDRRQCLTMCMTEETVRQATKPNRRQRQNPGRLWGAMQSFQEKMSMLLHVEDQLTEVAKSGQQLQLLIKKDEKEDKDGETSSTTTSDDEDEQCDNVEASQADEVAQEESKTSYQFSSGTRQLSQKEVEVLLAKGCLDAEEVRRLRSRLKELEEAANTRTLQPADKGCSPSDLGAKGDGQGPTTLVDSAPEGASAEPVKGKGKGPQPPGMKGAAPAPVGKGAGPPPPVGGGKGGPPVPSSGTGKGGPPAPPGKGKGKGSVGAPMFGRKWHWKSIQAHESQSTIWSELVRNPNDEGAPTPMTWRVDVSTMRDLFKEVVDPNAKKEVVKETVKTEIKVFDAKRAQNLAIGLMGLRNNCQVDLDDVARAVSNLDGGSAAIRSMEIIELIATLLPSPEEAKGLAAIPESQRQDLRDVEKQLWLLSRIPRLPARLRVLFFEKKQVDLEADARERLQMLSRAAQEARSSQAFRSFLTVCLSIGNFVNHSFVWRNDAEGVGYPPAAGFKLESALKLRDFQAAKSAKKEVSLLHIVLFHLARFVQDTWPEEPLVEEQATPCRQSVKERVCIFEAKGDSTESPAGTPAGGSASMPLAARDRSLSRRGSSLRPARTPKRSKTVELESEPDESAKTMHALKRWHKALLAELATSTEGLKDSLDDIQDDIDNFHDEVKFLEQERLTQAAAYEEPAAMEALQRIACTASTRATELGIEIDSVRNACQSLCAYFGEKVPKPEKLSEKTQEFMTTLTEVVSMLSRGVAEIVDKKPLQRICMLDFKMPEDFKLPEQGVSSMPSLPTGKAPLPRSLPPPGKGKGKGANCKGPPLPGAGPAAVDEKIESSESPTKETVANVVSSGSVDVLQTSTSAPVVKGKSKGKGPPLPGSWPVNFQPRVPDAFFAEEEAEELPEVPHFPFGSVGLPHDLVETRIPQAVEGA